MTPNPVATFRSHTVPTSRICCIVLVPGVCFDGRIPDTAQSQPRNDRVQIELLRESVAIIGPSPGCKSSPPKLEIRSLCGAKENVKPKSVRVSRHLARCSDVALDPYRSLSAQS
ncbi:hypothetical protein CSHISOI_06440 [Colletotrichum shisoi]|uniref:Uncharacterized protein n=1 Tax=Colletotrichum shisoi TaxID=2078593 RepID=A0A5Q4BPT6_9PEZI|nr:hypothetical protein CSHISOI_06440 [Colletotrichum shisoi]